MCDENNYLGDAEVTAIGENQLKDSNEINVRRMHIFFPMMIELDAQLLDPLPDQISTCRCWLGIPMHVYVLCTLQIKEC